MIQGWFYVKDEFFLKYLSGFWFHREELSLMGSLHMWDIFRFLEIRNSVPVSLKPSGVDLNKLLSVSKTWQHQETSYNFCWLWRWHFWDLVFKGKCFSKENECIGFFPQGSRAHNSPFPVKGTVGLRLFPLKVNSRPPASRLTCSRSHCSLD